jgi:hypothetical protein
MGGSCEIATFCWGVSRQRLNHNNGTNGSLISTDRRLTGGSPTAAHSANTIFEESEHRNASCSLFRHSTIGISERQGPLGHGAKALVWIHACDERFNTWCSVPFRTLVAGMSLSLCSRFMLTLVQAMDPVCRLIKLDILISCWNPPLLKWWNCGPMFIYGDQSFALCRRCDPWSPHHELADRV